MIARYADCSGSTQRRIQRNDILRRTRENPPGACAGQQPPKAGRERERAELSQPSGYAAEIDTENQHCYSSKHSYNPSTTPSRHCSRHCSGHYCPPTALPRRGSCVLWVLTWTHKSVTHIVEMRATKSQATTFTTFKRLFNNTSRHTVMDTVAQAVEPGLYFLRSPLGLHRPQSAVGCTFVFFSANR